MRDSTVRGKKTDGKKFDLEVENWHGMKEFNVQNQQLAEIDLTNLAYGSSLTDINLSENHLVKLELVSLQFCRNLASLDLSNNKLETVDLSSLQSDQAGTHYLKRIDLSSNSISELDLNNLVKCYNLLSFNISNNKLQKVDLSPLINCKKLKDFVMDKEVKIEWRNTNLDSSALPKGLRKYLRKIRKAWKEFYEEVDIFRKTEPSIEERLVRATWLESLEEKKGFDWRRIYSFARPIYSEVRNSYIYGCYRGTISTVFSLMESFLSKELPFEELEQEKKFQKRINTSESNPTEEEIEVDPMSLNLSKLASFAKKKGYISPSLYDRIYMYFPIRHSVIHYPVNVPLGFYRKTIRGTGTKSRGVGFESPGRRPILPTKLKDAAEQGIIILLDLLNEFTL